MYAIEETHLNVVFQVEGTRSALDKLNIRIEFSSENSPRGGPGGRGRGGRGGGGFRGGPRNERRGGRGGGFRGGFRGNNRGFSAGSAPRVDNEAEFPTLGSK